jgi:hypothetical protein
MIAALSAPRAAGLTSTTGARDKRGGLAAPQEPRMDQPTPSPAPPAPQGKLETLESLVGDWKRLTASSLDGAEKFAKEKPWIALIVAFVAGVIFDELLRALFRRRR